LIDKSFIGHVLPAVQWDVEKGRLRAFARAVGETRPEYIDEGAARAAGYPSLMAPLTMLFSAELDHGSTQALLHTLGVDIAKILHGEQSFTYHGPVFAGDVLRIEARVTDITDKKSGALEFITKESKATNQRGERVGEMRSVIVVRNT
jgi:acyl dehydratase